MKGGNTMEMFDYKKLTAKQIHDYMVANATDEQKKQFKEVAFTDKPKCKAQKLKDENGNDMLREARDKNNNIKLNEDGKPVMVAIKKMVAISGETVNAYNHLEAKKWFADTFKGVCYNVPTPAKKKETAKDLFNW